MSPAETLRRARRALAEPHLVVRQVNRAYHRLRGPDPDAVAFFEVEWDNLLLLDACRYDTFAERADLPGDLEARRTRSSSTKDFLEAYVDGADLRDTVYVTANPQLHLRRDDLDVNLHAVEHVWDEEGWDEEAMTVRPETLADAARAAHERYPHKRLVVHFIQPHYPFIGPTGREHLDLSTLHFWNRSNAGDVEVDVETLRRAYEENLDVALPVVEDLLADLGGRSVVTSDHGQLFGERASPIPVREYGHPTGHFLPELVTVPWHTFRNGPRRTVTVGESATSTAGSEAAVDADVERRLEQLGYT
jgi:hypothetical protein